MQTSVFNKVMLSLSVIAAFLAVVVIVGYIYWGVTTNRTIYNWYNFGTLTNGQAEQPDPDQPPVTDPVEYPVLELNIYENQSSNNPGSASLYEMRFNSWTNPNMQEVKGYGIQAPGFDFINWWNTFNRTFKFERWEAEEAILKRLNEWVMPFPVVHYESYGGESWKSVSPIVRGTPLIVNIGEDVYELKMDSYTVTRTLLGLLIQDFIAPAYGGLFASLIDSVRSNSYTLSHAGTFTIGMDLSRHFTVRKWNKTSLKFEQDTTATNEFVDIKTKVTYYKDAGVTQANQSLFKVFNGDPNWDHSGLNPGQDYAQERVVFRLGFDDFEYRQTPEGSFASPGARVVDAITNSRRSKVIIIFDLDAAFLEGINIIGLDYSSLRGIKIDTLRITSLAARTFTLLSGSLIDTELIRLERSSSVSLIINAGAVNNVFNEVVL